MNNWRLVIRIDNVALALPTLGVESAPKRADEEAGHGRARGVRPGLPDVVVRGLGHARDEEGGGVVAQGDLVPPEVDGGQVEGVLVAAVRGVTEIWKGKRRHATYF